MTREQVMESFKSKFASMIDVDSNPISDGKVRLVSRRLVTYDQCQSKPAIFISEGNEEHIYQSENLSKQTLSPILFIYFDAGLDPNTVPATQLNNLLDAVDKCLAPDNSDDKCTLGGLVSHCYISGEVLKIPGDLDGEGMAVIPINILVPTF